MDKIDLVEEVVRECRKLGADDQKVNNAEKFAIAVAEDSEEVVKITVNALLSSYSKVVEERIRKDSKIRGGYNISLLTSVCASMCLIVGRMINDKSKDEYKDFKEGVGEVWANIESGKKGNATSIKITKD